MKFILIAILLTLGQPYLDEIQIVENKHYKGVIFPKTYDMPYSENPPREQRFTPTIEEIDELESKRRELFKSSSNNFHDVRLCRTGLDI